LESLGISTPKLKEINDLNEVGSLVENIKQMYLQEYKSSSIFTDSDKSEIQDFLDNKATPK